MNILVTGGAGFTSSVLPGREAMLPEPCKHLAHMFYTDHVCRTTCLRYFNVYGPRHDMSSAYAADIPILLSRTRAGEDPVIYGDGGQVHKP